MKKQLIKIIVNNLKNNYGFNKRWRPTQTFSLGHVLYGWCPPQFISSTWIYRRDIPSCWHEFA